MTEAVQDREKLSLGRAFDSISTPADRVVAPSTGWRAADAALAICILTGLFIGSNLDRTPRGLEEFLALRLSIKNIVLLSAFGMAWPAVLSLCGLYAPARLREGRGEWPRLLIASAVGCALAMVFPLTSKSGAVRTEHAVLFAVAVAPAAALLRGTVRAAQRARRGTRQRQIIIVGSGPLAARMHWDLQSDPLSTSRVIGFVDTEPQAALGNGDTVHLGGVADLDRILMHRVVDCVFIGLPIKSRYEEIQQTLAVCDRVGVRVNYPADLFRRALAVSPTDGRWGMPVLTLPSTAHAYQLVLKRVMDILGALVLLVLLSPVMLVVGILVKLTNPGPAFFTQERYGYMKRKFRMHKFRTMVVDAEQLQARLEEKNEAAGPLFKIRNDPRFTPIGRFLRKTSLDELPQLWNVLVGEMSLVGPRPLPVRDVGRFTEPWLMRRFSVRPGLTCLWQVSGRSTLDFKRWIALDLAYVDRWSLWLDLKILALTVPAVVSGRGAD